MTARLRLGLRLQIGGTAKPCSAGVTGAPMGLSPDEPRRFRAPWTSARVPVPGPYRPSRPRRAYNSSGNPFNSASENTGPSTQTYLGPMLQRPQMPMPHFMRFSSVV
jgi:hypothetical protein